jgi:hypothetical protein
MAIYYNIRPWLHQKWTAANLNPLPVYFLLYDMFGFRERNEKERKTFGLKLI